MFFLLTTPLLQFHLLALDHYNFYAIDGLAGTQMPYLLVNLALASAAGLMFHVQWKLRYAGGVTGSNPLRRAGWVVLRPEVFVYAVVVVITNISVSIQLAVALPVLTAVFTMLLVLRDPQVRPGEGDRRFMLNFTAAFWLLAIGMGIITIMAVYVSPDLPAVLPDHNLIRSWEINFAGLGYSREEALDRVNLGYVWHAISLFAYMGFSVTGNVFAAIFKAGGGNGPKPVAGLARSEAGVPEPGNRVVRRTSYAELSTPPGFG